MSGFLAAGATRRASVACLLAAVVTAALVWPPAASADRSYRVRRGDTLIRIARRFDVPVRRLKRANRLRGDLIRVGTRLRIPGVHDGRGARPEELSPDQKEALERAKSLGMGSSKAAHRLLRKPPEPRWVQAAARSAEQGGMDGTLSLPVDEAVLLRGWGSGRGGYHLALDLGAKPGTPVHAAAPGLVAYAGSAVRGYGNIVIVVHPNGWVTWYAHHRRNLVVSGASVKRGQPLGTVGSSGYANGSHLHFMLVVDGEHCDALPLLRPPASRRGGAPLEVERAVWEGERPEPVRCAERSERPHPRRRRRRRRR